MQEINALQLKPILARSISETSATNNWITDICVNDRTVEASILSDYDGTLAGRCGLESLFETIDPKLQYIFFEEDGNSICKKQEIVRLKGSLRSILAAEPMALGFLAKMTTISTNTQHLLEQIKNYEVTLLEPRITTPGMGLIEKYAASVAGASKLRLFMTNGVFLRKNHIHAAGGITKAINKLTESLAPTIKIQVEVEDLKQVQEAREAGCDYIILKNLSCAEISMAVRCCQKKVLLEASNYRSLADISKLAATGIDFISCRLSQLRSDTRSFQLQFDPEMR